jgi:hypothetical protein
LTAEIAVLNKEAVALAADSAVTLNTAMGPKIYQSANKIFALSRVSPVGVMVYDSAQFLGVPWDTAIKAYRAELGQRVFPTLEDYASNFLGFFQRSRRLFPLDQRAEGAGAVVAAYFEALRGEIDQRLGERLAHGPLTPTQVRNEVGRAVTESLAQWDVAAAPGTSPGYEDRLRVRLEAQIDGARTRAFERLPMTAKTRAELTEVAVRLFARDRENPFSPFHSGVVIAGFGSNDVFPKLYEFSLEALVDDTLKYVQLNHAEIGPNGGGSAWVVPFAQRESVDAFMSGIDPDLEAGVRGFWFQQLQELSAAVVSDSGLGGRGARELGERIDSRIDALMRSFDDGMSATKHQDWVMPIIDAVAMLPKDELGDMAEALVNITSFKRKVSINAETVGGPIDVAVISKGDGLIWIKRKHYFESALNPQYFAAQFPRR